MNMKRIIGAGLALSLVASIGLVLGTPNVAHAGHGGSSSFGDTQTVNCGGFFNTSINQVIERSDLGRRLTINVKGTCVENVVIDRDHVTLQPAGSGGSIEAVTGGTEIWAVGVFGAQNVTIQDFDSIDGAGGIFAILISNGAQATVRNNTLHDAAQALGVYRNSTVIVENNWIHDNNGVGLFVTQSSGVIARRNMIIGSTFHGAVVENSSHVRFTDNEIDGESVAGVGVEVRNGSSVRFGGDKITDNANGVRILWNSFAIFTDDATEIHDNSVFGIECDLNSSMDLAVAPDFTGNGTDIQDNC